MKITVNRGYQLDRATKDMKDGPPWLTNVQVYKRHLVATDGHILAVVPCETEGNHAYGVPGELYKAGRVKGVHSGEFITLEADEKEAKVTTGTGVVSSPVSPDNKDGRATIPTLYRNAVREAKDGVMIAFNPYLLAELSRALGVDTKYGHITLQVNTDSPTKPMIVRPGGNYQRIGATGILMPIRMGAEGENPYVPPDFDPCTCGQVKKWLAGKREALRLFWLRAKGTVRRTVKRILRISE